MRENRDNAAVRAITDLMEKHFPGVREVDATYGAAQETRRGLLSGTRSHSKSGADIEDILEETPAAQRAPFRQALVQKSADALTQRDDASVSLLKQLLDQGEAGARKVRQYFPPGPEGDAAYARFQSYLGKERSAEKIGKALKWAAPFGIGGAFGWGLNEGARSLFR